ncbi:CTR copper uptake transporter [Cubamyces lactineus]|nr:CTR copper uptake transporter [Cubamyces lactineus]
MSLRLSVLYPLLLAVLANLLSVVKAHDNGMDMSMDGSMDLAEGQMLPYLHFTRGDIVLFYGWVPSTKKAMVGACIGMFLLALVERWIAACRGVMEAHWRKRAQIVQADRINLPTTGEKKPNLTTGGVRAAFTLRNAPPFVFSHDLARGLLHAVQAALQFAFMLIVMTFQVAFILSIVIGLGVGETLFGRFASHAAVH